MFDSITLGQYYQTDSVLHRLDPRVKLVGTFAYLFSLFVVNSFAGYALAALFLAVMIKLDSPGPVFYRQERVTTYGKHFMIHKFRSMVENADQLGAAVTSGDDERVTAVGSKLRHLRLDELPQLFDVLQGNSGKAYNLRNLLQGLRERDTGDL